MEIILFGDCRLLLLSIEFSPLRTADGDLVSPECSEKENLIKNVDITLTIGQQSFRQTRGRNSPAHST